MDKKKQIELRALAAELPIMFNTSHEVHIRTGKQMIEEDETVNLPNGEAIDPEVTYTVPYPVMIAVNHYRALKRIYAKFGNKGVIQYVAQVFAAEELKLNN